jgi:hypothetical protein
MESIISQLLLFLSTAYNYLVDFLSSILRETIFKSNPELAVRYSEGVTLLVTLTVIYLILEFFTAAKRIVRVILIIGWVLLILALVMEVGL